MFGLWGLGTAFYFFLAEYGSFFLIVLLSLFRTCADVPNPSASLEAVSFLCRVSVVPEFSHKRLTLIPKLEYANLSVVWAGLRLSDTEALT